MYECILIWRRVLNLSEFMNKDQITFLNCFFKKDLREHDGEVAAVFVYSPAVVLRKIHLIFSCVYGVWWNLQLYMAESYGC